MSITEGELESIRTEQEKFMPETVDIVKDVVIAPGNIATKTMVEATPAACTPGFGFWRNVADRFQGITAYTWTFPYGTEIESGHRIVDSEGRRFEVRDVRAPSSFHTAVQVLADHIN